MTWTRTGKRTKARADFSAADAELASTLDNLDGADNYAAWIFELIESYLGDEVLEVGAGHGTFTEMLARRAKRGRPALGSAPASVESVRLDPEMREQLLERATADGTTTSEVIRQALRRFLEAA